MGKQRQLVKLRALARNVRTSTTVGLWICTLTSIGLFIASFCVPPMGEISSSVLRAGSLIFAFAALFLIREAIVEGLGVRLTHGNTVIEVKDLNGNKPEDTNEINNDNEET